jgi:hypothetical protein
MLTVIKKCSSSSSLLWVEELSMDGNGEMVNVFTNDARKGWDVLKSGNPRLRKRAVYEKVEPLKHNSSINFSMGVARCGCSFTAENGHKELARYRVPKECSACVVTEWM